VTFVDYLNVGSSIVVRKDSPDVIGYRGYRTGRSRRAP
jgi:hypothetical protein